MDRTTYEREHHLKHYSVRNPLDGEALALLHFSSTSSPCCGQSLSGFAGLTQKTDKHPEWRQRAQATRRTRPRRRKATTRRRATTSHVVARCSGARFSKQQAVHSRSPRIQLLVRYLPMEHVPR